MKRRVLQFPLVILIFALVSTYIVCWLNSVVGFGGLGDGALFWEGWILIIWGCLTVGRSVMGVGLGLGRAVDDVVARSDGKRRVVGALDSAELQRQNRSFAIFGFTLVLTGVFSLGLHFSYAGFAGF